MTVSVPPMFTSSILFLSSCGRSRGVGMGGETQDVVRAIVEKQGKKGGWVVVVGGEEHDLSLKSWLGVELDGGGGGGGREQDDVNFKVMGGGETQDVVRVMAVACKLWNTLTFPEL